LTQAVSSVLDLSLDECIGKPDVADTYLLESLTFDDIAKLHEKKPEFFQANPSTGHGLLVSNEAPNGGAYRIARVLPGDNSDVVRSWLEGRALDLLVRHFEQRPPTKAAKERAVERWKKAHERYEEIRRRANELAQARRAVLHELEEAKDEEDEACRELVRTHGRARIWVDGVQWEVNHKPDKRGQDTVYYRRCRPPIHESK
jgi:hypothetical protein